MKISIENGTVPGVKRVVGPAGLLVGIITTHNESHHRVEMFGRLDRTFATLDKAIGYVHGVADHSGTVTK